METVDQYRSLHTTAHGTTSLSPHHWPPDHVPILPWEEGCLVMASACQDFENRLSVCTKSSGTLIHSTHTCSMISQGGKFAACINEFLSAEIEHVAKTSPLPCSCEHRLFLDSLKPSQTDSAYCWDTRVCSGHLNPQPRSRSLKP